MSHDPWTRVWRLVRRARAQGVPEAAINATLRAHRGWEVASISDLEERIAFARGHAPPVESQPLDALRNVEVEDPDG